MNLSYDQVRNSGGVNEHDFFSYYGLCYHKMRRKAGHCSSGKQAAAYTAQLTAILYTTQYIFYTNNKIQELEARRKYFSKIICKEE